MAADEIGWRDIRFEIGPDEDDEIEDELEPELWPTPSLDYNPYSFY